MSIQGSQVSSFTIRPYRMNRLKDWAQRMSNPRDHVIYDGNVARVLKETGFGFEESPRSIYSPEKLYEALDKFRPHRISEPILNEHFRAGAALARACFARQTNDSLLEPMDFSMRSINEMTTNPSASAGLTAYGQTKAESMVRAYQRGLQTLLGSKKVEPCLAFSRTQFNGKTRLVWGYPFSMTAIEGVLARPLTTEFKKGYTPMAFAKSTGVLGAQLRTASYRKKYAYSVDMSSYDASISAKLINVAFDILETWFDPHAQVYEGIAVRDVWKIIRYYFIHTPIVMPNMKLYLGKMHGVPSGSYFTQIIDSIVNVIICGAITHRFNLKVDKKDIFVLGDDLLFWTNREISLDTLANFATQQFGVEFNAKKSARFTHEQPIHYLGRDWEHGIPDLPEPDILARMVFPERFRIYSKVDSTKQREVALLLFSYATVYKSAWHILKKIYAGRGPIWRIGPESVDFAVRGMGDDFINEGEPNHLSGLARYNLIYASEGRKQRKPLALLFWA